MSMLIANEREVRKELECDREREKGQIRGKIKHGEKDKLEEGRREEGG